MRTRALPLRILLILALILNGVGGAMAGVLAVMPAAAAPALAAHANGAQTGDCHDRDAGAPAPAAHAVSAPACHASGSSDCNDGLECRQACMHASLAVPPLLLVGVERPGADALLHPLANGHPSPPLRNVTRPPIA